MSIETNGGVLTTNMMGLLPGYGDVWFHPDAITNILALCNVKKKYRITYGSAKEDAFDLPAVILQPLKLFKAKTTIPQ